MYNTEVGYCQGMSQIAALLLMYMNEEVSLVFTVQGTYSFWKSQKIGRHFSSQGKVREFGIYSKNQGILIKQFM